MGVSAIANKSVPLWVVVLLVIGFVMMTIGIIRDPIQEGNLENKANPVHHIPSQTPRPVRSRPCSMFQDPNNLDSNYFVKDEPDTMPYRDPRIKTKVVIGVTAAIGRKVNRDRQRKAFELACSVYPEVKENMVLLFIIGRNEKVEGPELKQEMEQYKDIVQISTPDEDDGLAECKFNALTRKVYEFIKYTTHNYDCQYVFRLGDDAWINADLLLKALGEMPKTKLLYGRFNHAEGTNWFKSQYYNVDKMLPYPGGMGFVLSIDLAEWLTNTTVMPQFYYPEDGYIGLWFAGIEINRMDDRTRIHDHTRRGSYNSLPTSDQTILLHYMTQKDFDAIDPKTAHLKHVD